MSDSNLNEAGGTAVADASGSLDSGAGTIVNSTSDMLAGAPPDLFANAIGSEDNAEPDPLPDTGGEDAAGEIETEEPEPDQPEGETEEPSGETEEPSGETEEEPDSQAQPEKETDQPEKKADQPEELPEGVSRGKDRNGKPGLFVDDSRWKNIYGNHQLVQKASEILGEPATLEALELRNQAYVANEQMFHNLLSGDPQAQGHVLGYFFDEMARAREAGEVGIDPAVPMARTFFDTLQEKSPDGYSSLRMTAAQHLVGEMFDEAANSDDESLCLSAQHFARKLAGVAKDATLEQLRTTTRRMGIPFYTKAELPSLKRGQADPVRNLQAENANLKTQLSGRTEQSQAAQLDGWRQATSKAVTTSVLDNAVRPALASVAEAWKAFPNDYQDLVEGRLHRRVSEVIEADKGFAGRIRLLHQQALRAPSAQRRDELGKQIQQAYVNRAKLAVDAVKRPVLDFAATLLRERSNDKHARRAAAQNRTAPNGSSSTVPRSILPKDIPQMPGNVFDPAVAVRQAKRLLGG